MTNSSPGAPAIDVTGLRVARGGREVLHGLSFRVPRGTVTGLLGPSGCGKTTLIRCVVGTQTTAGGTVTVLGEPAGSAPLRGRVGYATQSPALYADLTVQENLRYFAALLHAGDDIERVVAVTELGPQRHQTVGSLSGGQRMRASIAAALLGRPPLLVLDEPTVGLDPVLRNQLWRLFHGLAADGATLLVSSHVMDEAGRCGRLLLLRDGRLLADDTPDGLRARTGTPDLEQAFLRLIAEQAGSDRQTGPDQQAGPDQQTRWDQQTGANERLGAEGRIGDDGRGGARTHNGAAHDGARDEEAGPDEQRQPRQRSEAAPGGSEEDTP